MTGLRSCGATARQARRGAKAPGQAVKTALAAWGAPLPDWIEHLAREVDATSTARAARRVKYSAPVVSSVLRRTYAGDYGAVEHAVKGALMDYRVDCPVLGPIAAVDCSAHQRRKLTAVNPTAVRLWRACRAGCPHSRLDRTERSPR